MLRREAIQAAAGGILAPFGISKKESQSKKFDSFLRMYYCIGAKLTYQDMTNALNSYSPNLDFYYPYQYVQNEQHEGTFYSSVLSKVPRQFTKTTFFTNYNPILTGSMSGTIYFDETAICTFVDWSQGIFGSEFVFKCDPYFLRNSFELDISGSVNSFGEFSFNWKKIPFRPYKIKIVVSYEYSMEVQVSPPIFESIVGIPLSLESSLVKHEIKVGSLDSRTIVKNCNANGNSETFLSEMNNLVLPSDGFKFVLDENYIKAIKI